MEECREEGHMGRCEEDEQQDRESQHEERGVRRTRADPCGGGERG